MISRRTRWRAVLLLVLTLGLLAAPAPAQQAGRVPKIAFVRSGPPPKGFVEAFQRGLRDLGYVEGRTMVVEYRFTDGTPAQLTDAVGELLRLKVDVIVASGLPATLAAKDMTRTVPIVFPAVVGANLTGLSLNAPDLLPKRLEALGQVVPRLSRVAVLRNPASPGSAPEALKELERGAHALGVQLDMVDARGPNAFEAAFSAAKKSQALLQLDDVLFTTHRDRLVGLALRHRLPAIYGFREHVDTGGLMSYGPNIPELYRRSATFVDKILKGAKPGELPIEQPATFELAASMPPHVEGGQPCPSTCSTRPTRPRASRGC